MAENEEMVEITVVSPRVFRAIQNVAVSELLHLSSTEIRPILPCLVRMSLISPFDNSRDCAKGRQQILTLLSNIELVNTIVALLSIDFHALESDVKKEQQLRQKVGNSHSDSILIQSLQNGLALEFERSDSTRRLRLVLSELLFISSQIQQQQQQHRSQEFFIKQSGLFDNICYIEDICDVICIAIAELPAVLNIEEVVETLLHVKHGPQMICWVVANSPDCFRQVCISLIANANGEEDSIRTRAVAMLCQMNPIQALVIRSKCVELCRMPALAIVLSLEHSGPTIEGDMVAFISGLLLGNDQQVRNWFVLFVRNAQKRKWDSGGALHSLRENLLHRLQSIVLHSMDSQLPDSCVVQASALLRLYCALRGIALIKFQDEEVSLIVQLLTSHPPPTPAGVRFVSLGLCMLIACPSLIAVLEHEQRCIEWVRWLVREEAYFESASGVTASFGEMLLLMAIHFHSNQLSAICELVCATLGMKVAIRPNNMTRMKQIFTHEIFTEQVVTSHAVKVPVTANLNANIPGFLPVHCIHQLLKSRAFTKHRVPIKSWIYRQICCSIPPLHPVLPALVEVYVNSILIQSAKCPQEHTNQPMSEDEIRRVFQNSALKSQAFVIKPSMLPRTGLKWGSTPLIEEVDSSDSEPLVKPSLTSQLLLLYYLLLYEDVRLSQTQTHKQAGRKVKSYSTEFISELPIKYLLQQAQKDQQSYAGLFPPLLRLLASHFPHLSLVDNWLDEEVRLEICTNHSTQAPVTQAAVAEALSHMAHSPSRAGRLLHRLLALPATDIWPFAETFIRYFKTMLDDKVPRYIQELYRQVWLRLNTVLPRCLWAATINALLTEGQTSLTQQDLVSNPMLALRCDPRVFRCAVALSIVMRVLQALLAASHNHLERFQRDRALPERNGANQAIINQRNENRKALVTHQDALAVQILMEACREDEELPGQQFVLREVRSVVCSYLHQVFIADPLLVKIVHFQTYPRELLPIVVRGIPSMHICLDFIPELLSQPTIRQQVFATDLVSHLALQYALPKSLSVARLVLNTLSTLLAVLPFGYRMELFSAVLPSVVRLCEAFPALFDDAVMLLMQLARVSISQVALDRTTAHFNNSFCAEIEHTYYLVLTRASFDKEKYLVT